MLTVNFNQLAVSRPARLALLASTCRNGLYCCQVCSGFPPVVLRLFAS